MKDINIELFHEKNQKLENLWLNLEKNADITPFQTFSWFDFWLKFSNVKNSGDLYIYVVNDYHNNPLAIIPLIRKKYYFIKKLELIGDKKAEYKFPLIRKDISENTLINIWKLLFKKLPIHDYFVIDRYPLTLKNRLKNVDLIKVGFSKFYIENSVSTEKFEDLNKLMSNISKNNKRNIKNKQKLIKLGNYKFSVIKEKNDYFTTLNQIKKSMYKKLDKLGISNKIEINENTNFFKLFWNFIGDKDSFRPLLVGLYFNDELLSASWSLIHRDCLYYIFGGLIDDNMKRFNTGTLMQFELINYAFKKDCKIIDFTLGDEIYKFRWGGKINRLTSYVKFNSFKGKLFSFYFFLIFKIKGLKSIKNLYRNLKKISFQFFL